MRPSVAVFSPWLCSPRWAAAVEAAVVHSVAYMRVTNRFLWKREKEPSVCLRCDTHIQQGETPLSFKATTVNNTTRV